MNKNTNKTHPALSLLEIAAVILSGFVVSYIMKIRDVQVFALPHLTVLVLAIIIRTLAGGWKWPDWGFASNIGRQIGYGLKAIK